MNNILINSFVLATLASCMFILMVINSSIKWILKLIISISIFGAFWSACFFGINDEIKNWNDGYCIKCGTPYQAVSYWRGSTRYECPKCHFAFSK